MKKSVLEFWVGLFVLIGVVALGVLSFRVAGGQSGFSGQANTYQVYANFTDIGSLKVQAPVKSSGVLVGRVSNIELDSKTYLAKVSLDLDKRYQFSTDVTAQILTSGILGEQYIGLQQGGEETNLAEGGTIEITSSAMVLENLIGKFMTNFSNSSESKSDSKSESK